MDGRKIFILITSPPYTSRYPNKAYEYARFLANNGAKVIMFHFMDGLHNLSKNQFTLNFPTINKIVEELIELGIEIACCSRCLMARGYWNKEKTNIDEKIIIPDNLIDNVKVYGVSKIGQSIEEGYKIIKF